MKEGAYNLDVLSQFLNNPLIVFNCLYGLGIYIDNMDVKSKTINISIPDSSEIIESMRIPMLYIPKLIKIILINSNIIDVQWKYLYKSRNERWTYDKKDRNMTIYSASMHNIMNELYKE